MHGEAVWGEDLHQGRRHIVGGHAVRLGGVHLEVELEYFLSCFLECTKLPATNYYSTIHLLIVFDVNIRAKRGRGHEKRDLESAISKDVLVVSINLSWDEWRTNIQGILPLVLPDDTSWEQTPSSHCRDLSPG